MQITSLSPQNQVQVQRSLARGRKINRNYIQAGNFWALLTPDRFKGLSIEETIRIIEAAWWAAQPSWRLVLLKFVHDNLNAVYECRSNANFAADIGLHGDTVRDALAYWHNIGAINKLHLHKFATVFYSLPGSLKYKPARKKLAGFIETFGGPCLDLLLSGVSVDSSLQVSFTRHINITNAKNTYAFGEIRTEYGSFCRKSLYKRSNARKTTPEERLGKTMQILLCYSPGAAQDPIESRFLQRPKP